MDVIKKYQWSKNRVLMIKIVVEQEMRKLKRYKEINLDREKGKNKYSQIGLEVKS